MLASAEKDKPEIGEFAKRMGKVSLTGTISNFKSAFGDLLKSVDLDKWPGVVSFQNFLTRVTDALKGDAGKQLLSTIEKIMNSLLGGLASIKDSNIESFVKRIASLGESAVGVIKEAWRWLDRLLNQGDQATVARVMGGERAALMATDPPYGVAYTVETGVGSKFGAIANDENDGPRLQAFLESAFGAAKTALLDNAAWYLWHAQMTQGFFAAAAAAAAAVIIHRQIIWVKPSLILGHGDYHWRHELCFYGWVEGHRPPWYGDRKQTTVWEIGRENDGVHPTQKPIEIFERPLQFNTCSGDIAYEPFCGSGSQIIACENLSRRCRAVEISPAYVAVALERWATHTGKTPVLIE